MASASTSDRFDGILPKKHADAAAIGLIPIACHLSTVLSGRLLLDGLYSLYDGGITLRFPLSLNVTRMARIALMSLCAEPMMAE